MLSSIVTLSLLVASVASHNFLISNDDGWATAQARAQYDSLVAAGFDVGISTVQLDITIDDIFYRFLMQIILSAPAIAHSGQGAKSQTPTVLKTPC